MNQKILILISVLLFCNACSTMSNRTKTIVSMASVGVLAGSLAALSAPKNENALAHGALWAGGTASVTGIVGLFMFDEEKRASEAQRKFEATQKEIDAIRGESLDAGQSRLTHRGESLEKTLPKEYQKLVRPGKWSIYQINQWITQGDNTLIHQDKMLRLEPAQFQFEGLDPESQGQIKPQESKGEK